jgi:hypothetical protein
MRKGSNASLSSDYEFQFKFNSMFRAVHIVGLQSDEEACARALAYLDAAPEIDSVVVTCGVRFVRKISYADEPEEASSHSLAN